MPRLPGHMIHIFGRQFTGTNLKLFSPLIYGGKRFVQYNEDDFLF